jgi:glutamate-1-semialdehyde 2,1-aminomutase
MSRSTRLLSRARDVIPGGVNSPVRAFAAVGGEPPFIARGEGAHLIDEDGHRYLDLVGSWGALLLGHAPRPVIREAIQALLDGSSFGAPTARETDLAMLIRERVPSMQKVRLCSSGTEATMHALRLARGATGRDLVIKLDGCYHGAHDAMLVSAGSGVATFAQPGSPGIPAAVAACTLVAPFNDVAAVRALLEQHRDQVAAVILEPVAGNMGCIAPVAGYLEGLRELTTEHGALLIFDEVMCGFRAGPGGAQERYGVTPDLTCLGKIVGGGFPLAAFGGSAALMDHLSPVGPVYQAGTLSGNPVAVAAGIATLEALDGAVYHHLDRLGLMIEAGLQDAVDYHGCSLTRVGSMFTVFFRPEAPTNFAEVKECDLDAFARFHRAALNGGVYLPPSQFEAAFISAALTERDVADVVEALQSALVAAV